MSYAKLDITHNCLLSTYVRVNDVRSIVGCVCRAASLQVPLSTHIRYIGNSSALH